MSNNKLELSKLKIPYIIKHACGNRFYHSAPQRPRSFFPIWFDLLIWKKKAFDTMDHAILLEKLTLYGDSSRSIIWFHSYLIYGRRSPKAAKFSIDGAQSDFCFVTCGIPQGSILGPLLFTICTITLHVICFQPRIYADDTTLTSFAEDPYVLEHKTNRDMT